MERFGVHLVPLSLYQTICDIASVSSWHRAGYGWPDPYGRGYGRRRGCWSGIPEDVWFCDTCRMVLKRCGAKVLSWSVSGGVFLSQTSMLKTGVLKLGMTEFCHVLELIPRPKTMEGMSDPMRTRALHTMVTNTWMNANTEQELFTAPEYQFCQALRGNNGMTAGQKLLESEQMDCRGAGVVQLLRGPDGCGCVDGFDGSDGSDGFDGGVDGFDGGFDGFDGVDGGGFDGFDGGFDGFDGGFDGFDGGFDGFDGSDGVDGGGFDGFDGLDGFDGTRARVRERVQ